MSITFDTHYEDEEGREIDCKVTFGHYPGTPGSWYADPPQEEEPAIIEIEDVQIRDSEFGDWTQTHSVDEENYGEEVDKQLISECWEWLADDASNR